MNEMRMALVRQRLPRPRVEDPAAAVEQEAVRLLREWSAALVVNRRSNDPHAPEKRPWRLALPVGSRGIAGLPGLVRAIVRAARQAGAEPFLVPAMGSHGGGTPEGQVRLLEHLGVTAESVEAPIVAEPDVVVLGRTPDGGEVAADARLAAADAVFLFNRVKPHTSFHGPVESGLLKMLAVGIGKTHSATSFHTLPPEALSQGVLERARVALAALPVVGGIAVVENGYDEIAMVRGLRSEEIARDEPDLLNYARSLLPRLPVENLDLLVVDQIGKNFSGTGMDTNVIGRLGIAGQPEPERPRVQRIFVRGLSPETDGNAYGIGLADFTTRRVFQQARLDATYANALATGFLRRAMWPLILPSDRAALEAAAASLKQPLGSLRAVRIRSTLSLETLQVSAPLHQELLASGAVEPLGDLRPLVFNDEGDLTDEVGGAAGIHLPMSNPGVRRLP